MSFKISKWPWKVIKNQDSFGNIRFFTIQNYENKTIAEIFIQPTPTGIFSEEEVNNAYLLSSSPEMLEVLELIQAWLLATRQSNDMLDLIAYTIEKAKGKLGVDKSRDSLL